MRDNTVLLEVLLTATSRVAFCREGQPPDVMVACVTETVAFVSKVSVPVNKTLLLM